jgi:hypothetical protein
MRSRALWSCLLLAACAGDLFVESNAGARGFRNFSRNLFRALEPAGGSRLPRSS